MADAERDRLSRVWTLPSRWSEFAEAELKPTICPPVSPVSARFPLLTAVALLGVTSLLYTDPAGCVKRSLP